MSKLLLDTNFIIAYLLPSDSLHKRSVELEETKNISLNECYISNQIISEVMNILGQKDSVEYAKTVYNMMKDNFIWINEYDIPNFNDCVLSNYKKLNSTKNGLKIKPKLGFTDCSIITVAEYYDLDGIVTFDCGFLNNGVVDIIF